MAKLFIEIPIHTPYLIKISNYFQKNSDGIPIIDPSLFYHAIYFHCICVS